MRSLADLPHRFWPERQLPDGVQVWPKGLNLKAAEFIKIYNKKVNPRLKALGFTCKRARASKLERDRVAISSFAGSSAGGNGSLAFGVHRIGLPSRPGFPVDATEVDFQHCLFMLQTKLYEGTHGAFYDLGKDETEGEETAALMLEVIEEQAVPFLAGIDDALGVLAELEVADFDIKLPALVKRHHIRVTDSALTPFAQQRIELALLVARLAHLAGNTERVATWSKFGVELLAASDWPPYPRHTYAIHFEKLLAGVPDLALTAEDRAERDRRMG